MWDILGKAIYTGYRFNEYGGMKQAKQDFQVLKPGKLGLYAGGAALYGFKETSLPGAKFAGKAFETIKNQRLDLQLPKHNTSIGIGKYKNMFGDTYGITMSKKF